MFDSFVSVSYSIGPVLRGLSYSDERDSRGILLQANLAGCLECITRNTGAYGRDAAYSEPKLKTLGGRAKVLTQLHMDHKQCLPQLR